VAGQTGSVADNRVKTTRGERGASGRAWAVLSSAHVGACGHAGRRFFAGFSAVNFIFVLYTMVCSKTRLENFDF
jgi:hypothetical protein